jgi:hypothetical protein
MRLLPELSRNVSRCNLETTFGQWANLKNTLRFRSRCSKNSPSDVTIRHCDDFDIALAAKLQVKFNGT